MNIKQLIKCGLFIWVAILFANVALAQNTLPSITVITEKGYNIISWINPYKSGVKTIVVERSVDSNFNYTPIGFVNNFDNPVQSYVDVTPLAGVNWYRVKVVFESEIEWISDYNKVNVDSSDIINRKQIVSVDTLQKKVNEAIEREVKAKEVVVNSSSSNNKVEKQAEIKKEKIVEKVVEKSIKSIEIPKSKYIFINPFSGNVNIELPDVRTYNYKVSFYNPTSKKLLFDIPRIHEESIILDKRNFQNVGNYDFIIWRDDKEFERGTISIY
jgi:hypothetical protein